jgi:hypothetical protein
MKKVFLFLFPFFFSVTTLAQMPPAAEPAQPSASAPTSAPTLIAAPPSAAIAPSPSTAPVISPAATPAAPAGFYYFCARTTAYFPTVADCADGWIAIPVGSPPPAFERRSPEFFTQEPNDVVQGRPNSATLEIGGQSLYYSLNIDHALNNHWTLGIGISYWEDSNWWRSYQSSITVVPVYANYYFTEKQRRGFISFGADWINSSNPGYSNSTFTNSGVAGVVGGGYEHRANSGFILRLGGSLIVGRSVSLSPFASFGLTF